MSSSLFSQCNLWRPEVISTLQEPVETRPTEQHNPNEILSSPDPSHRKKTGIHDREEFKNFMKEAVKNAALRNSARQALLENTRRHSQSLGKLSQIQAMATSNSGLNLARNYSQTAHKPTESSKWEHIAPEDSANNYMVMSSTRSQPRKRKQGQERDQREVTKRARLQTKVSNHSTAGAGAGTGTGTGTTKGDTCYLHEIELNKQITAQGARHTTNTTTMATTRTSPNAQPRNKKKQSITQKKTRTRRKNNAQQKQQRAREEILSDPNVLKFLDEISKSLSKTDKSQHPGKQDFFQLAPDPTETKAVIADCSETVSQRPQPYLSRYSELAFVKAFAGI